MSCCSGTRILHGLKVYSGVLKGFGVDVAGGSGEVIQLSLKMVQVAGGGKPDGLVNMTVVVSVCALQSEVQAVLSVIQGFGRREERRRSEVIFDKSDSTCKLEAHAMSRLNQAQKVNGK